MAGRPLPLFHPSEPRRPLVITVTGGAGQIAYALLPLLASGYALGSEQRVSLRLLDLPATMEAMRGVAMELEDGAYPLLDAPVGVTDDPRVAFDGCDVAVLLGSFPRKPGMERKELLARNATIFREQGESIKAVARGDIRVLVVGNPANTNAWILSQYAAPAVPPEHIMALTRLDHNRTRSLVARTLHCRVDAVDGVVVWGNHSSTQYPDVSAATAPNVPRGGMRAAVGGEAFLRDVLIPTVQTRGAAVLAARKLSSAMSAANAIADHLRDWLCGMKAGDSGQSWVSAAVMSDGSYGIEPGVFYSFPVRCTGGGAYEIVHDLPVDEFSRKYMQATGDELIAERDEAIALLRRGSAL